MILRYLRQITQVINTKEMKKNLQLISVVHTLFAVIIHCDTVGIRCMSFSFDTMSFSFDTMSCSFDTLF